MALVRRFNLLKLTLVLLVAAFFARYFFTPQDEAIFDSFLHLFLLVIHEAGHIIMAPFGTFMMFLGGTLWQLIIPLVLVMYFALTRQPFSAGLLLFLVAFSLVDASVYVADAQERALPLITGLQETHDWWNLLRITGLLAYDNFLARIFFVQGLGFYGLACYLGLHYAQKAPGPPFSFLWAKR